MPPGISSDLTTVAPLIRLEKFQDLESLLRTRSANHRSKIRRKMNSASRGNSTLRVAAADDVKGALRLLDDLLVAYDLQHGGEAQPHLFKDPRNIDFYRRLIQYGLPQEWLHVSALEIAGRCVSWHVGFLWKGTFSWYKPCHARDEKHLAPGHLHIAYLLTAGFREGWRVFDFTVGDEEYKSSWTPLARPIYGVSWFVPRLRSRFHALGSRMVGLLTEGRRWLRGGPA
jgi:CelD/BcsL family acetyltransferase involved in cellulose biosynthesis